MTIPQLLNEGQATVLGPVTVVRDFGVNNKTRTPLRALVVSDASHQDGIKLKLWGAAANSPLQQGATITVRTTGDGGITVGQYQGKSEFNANKATVEVQGGAPTTNGGGASAPPAGAGAGGGAGAGQPVALTSKQLANAMAQFAFDFGVALKKKGFPDELRLELIKQAPQFAALWWFGQRFVQPDRAPAPKPEPQTVEEPQPEDQAEIPGEDPNDQIPF